MNLANIKLRFEGKEVVQKFLSGQASRKEVIGSLGVPDSYLSSYLKSLGVTNQTHLWFKNYGFVPRFARSISSDAIYTRYQSNTLRELSSLLGRDPSVICGLFRNLGYPFLSRSLVTKKVKKTNMTRFGTEWATQSSEVKARQKEKCLALHGVEHHLKLPSVKEKRKQTCLRVYGVTSTLQNPDIKAKAEATNLAKLGVTNPFFSSVIQKRVKATNVARYGHYCSLKNPAIWAKRANTLRANYGVDNPMHSPEILRTMAINNKLKYGVACTLQSPAIIEKTKKTNFLRFGVEWSTQSPAIRSEMSQTKMNNFLKAFLKSLEESEYEFRDDYQGLYQPCNFNLSGKTHRRYKFFHKLCCREFTSYISTRSFQPHCSVCYPFNSFRSKREVFYENFIASLGIEVRPAKSLLSPGAHKGAYDIDVFAPSKMVGFEVNGLYWHSVNGKDNVSAKDENYHATKTSLAARNGISLYHIWEHYNPIIIKSMIRSALGVSEKVYLARKTSFVELSQEEASLFLDSNHLHSSALSFLSFGLRDKISGELLQVISFRRTKDPLVVEISRSASLLNARIIGGFSKLLHNSIGILQALGFTSILTFADRDWSPIPENTVYYKVGFTYQGDSGPSMYYTDFVGVWDRRSFQKHRILRGDSRNPISSLVGKELKPDFIQDSFTEHQILSAHGIYPLYNSGNHKFSLPI